MHLSKNQLEIIQDFFKNKPIEKAWLFGSYVRGEANIGSDVDLIVRIKKEADKKLSLFGFIAWVQELEEILGKKIDMITEGNISKYVLPYVEKEKKLIYEKK